VKRSIALGFALTLVPLLALELIGVLPVEGGHGLGEWMLESACFALLCLGAVLNGFLARRGSRVSLAMALVAVAALLAFLARFGVPFRT